MTVHVHQRVRSLPSLFENARRFASHASLTSNGVLALDYQTFLDQIDSVAAWLHDRRVGPGDRIGIFLPKSVPETIATLAVARLGAVFVNLGVKTTAARVAEIMRECSMRHIFTTTAHARELESIAREINCRVVVMPQVSHGITNCVSFDSLPVQPFVPCYHPGDHDLAAILYTSGSTGRSKGVMISQRNFIDATVRVGKYLELEPEDRLLSILPLSAPWGVLQFTTALAAGASVHLQSVAFPVEIIRSIIEAGITGFAAMPPTWIQLVDHLLAEGQTLPGLRFVTSSGGVIPPRILDAFPHVFPNAKVYLTYGLTEAFRTTVLPPEWFASKRGSLGKPCPGVDIYIIKPGGGLCGPGECGELIHRGSPVTLGYWNDPDATSAVYKPCPELESLIGNEIVHYSGDMVERDNDGFLWFVGRRDALIKVAGHRVSVEEIEIAAMQSGLVSQAVAFGTKDPVFGQVIEVAVELLPPARLDAELLLNYCRRTLPSHMVPRRLHWWNTLMPRTVTGKIDRDAVIRAHSGQVALLNGPNHRTESIQPCHSTTPH